jgi:hypothetical protein
MHRACWWGTGPQRRRPISSDPIACTHRSPSARPSQNLTTRYSPARNRPSPQQATSSNAQPAVASIRSQRSCPPMHAAYQRGPATSAAPCSRGSVPATLPRHLRCDCLHASPPLCSPRAEPSPPATAPRATAPAPRHATSSMQGRRSQPPAHSAAARRCTQRTAEVQPRQLRHPSETRCQRRCPVISDPIVCTHRRPSARRAQALTSCYSPARNRPSPTPRNIIHALPAVASTRSQRSCRQCTPRTAEVQPRQLCHPHEARCQRRRPTISENIACTHRRPSARPSQATASYSPACNCPSPQHASASAHCRRSQAPAQSAAVTNARSVLLRFSDVSCGILTRLGAIEVAPAALISLPARITAPRLAPSPSPTHPLQPRAHPPQPTARVIIHAQPAFASTRSQRSSAYG